MKLYHGSFSAVDKPDLAHSRGNVDFEKAFTLRRFTRRQRNGVPVSNAAARTALYLFTILTRLPMQN